MSPTPGVTARSLRGHRLEIASTYRTLGDTRERDALNRIVSVYGDQPAAAAARVRLAAMSQTEARPTLERTDASERHAGEPIRLDASGLRGHSREALPDGRLLPYRDLDDVGGLFLRDVAAGTNRLLIKFPDAAEIGYAEHAEGSAFSRDGRLLAFAWRVRGIYQLRVVGVEPRHPRRCGCFSTTTTSSGLHRSRRLAERFLARELVSRDR